MKKGLFLLLISMIILTFSVLTVSANTFPYWIELATNRYTSNSPMGVSYISGFGHLLLLNDGWRWYQKNVYGNWEFMGEFWRNASINVNRYPIVASSHTIYVAYEGWNFISRPLPHEVFFSIPEPELPFLPSRSAQSLVPYLLNQVSILVGIGILILFLTGLLPQLVLFLKSFLMV